MREHVIGERRRVREALQCCIGEASIAQILEPSSNSVRLLPLKTNLLRREKNFLWRSNAITQGLILLW